MRRPTNIRIAPNGLSGFIVYWQMEGTHPDEFKILQNRKQLMRLLEMILDEGTGKEEEG